MFILSFVLFSVFVFDVVLGAFFGFSVLGDTQEMFVLLCASIVFSVVILRRERDEALEKQASSREANK
jgi:hypothetical protein